jgi:hypothetical protein
MNLAAENQVWATVNHQGVTAVLLYKFWSICGDGMRKKRKGAANDEKNRAEIRFVSMGNHPL